MANNERVLREPGAAWRVEAGDRQIGAAHLLTRPDGRSFPVFGPTDAAAY